MVERIFDGTKVDLGEDLLENNTVSDPSNQNPAQDDLQKAEIFSNERLFDDAKKILRKILRVDSSNARALKLLEEIQEKELQELLSPHGGANKLLSEQIAPEDEPADKVIKKLEHDLRLGLNKNEIAPVPDLFKTIEEYHAFAQKIHADAVRIAPRQRIDLGVAFFEMGLFEVARAVFETVVRYEEHRLAGLYLLCLSLIESGKEIEATILMAPHVRDVSVADVQKIDFLYLMGIAFEKLDDRRKAREFFSRVARVDPKYKNVQEKVARGTRK